MKNEPESPRYNEAAVEAAIVQARRKSNVSGREAKAIHALLKGWRK